MSEPNIASSIGGTGEVAAGDFGSNRRILDTLVGAGDLAQVPANQPHWMAGVPLRRILFPTGDPGFEHLIEASLAGGSIADIVKSRESVAAVEDPLWDSQDPGTADEPWNWGMGNNSFPPPFWGAGFDKPGCLRVGVATVRLARVIGGRFPAPGRAAGVIPRRFALGYATGG